MGLSHTQKRNQQFKKSSEKIQSKLAGYQADLAT
jgi:hypothetical protein